MLAIEQGRQITPEEPLRFMEIGPAYGGCMLNVVAVFGRDRARVVGIEPNTGHFRNLMFSVALNNFNDSVTLINAYIECTTCLKAGTCDREKKIATVPTSHEVPREILYNVVPTGEVPTFSLDEIDRQLDLRPEVLLINPYFLLACKEGMIRVLQAAKYIVTGRCILTSGEIETILADDLMAKCYGYFVS